MSIKLIAIDLDDTLLDSKLRISARNKKVLQQARSKGVKVTLATGRMFSMALPLAEELDIDIPLITSQGALVKKSKSDEILYSRMVPAVEALKVIQIVRDYGYHYQVYHGDNIYVDKITPEGKAYSEQLKTKSVLVNDLQIYLNEEPIKIMIINNDVEQLYKFEQELNNLFKDKLFIIRSKPNYLEVMNREASKLLALKELTLKMNIEQSEVMAIGDSYTDLEIIKWAGIGVAMGNSFDDIVKKEADYITCSNDEDGVAEAIIKFVL